MEPWSLVSRRCFRHRNHQWARLAHRICGEHSHVDMLEDRKVDEVRCRLLRELTGNDEAERSIGKTSGIERGVAPVPHAQLLVDGVIAERKGCDSLGLEEH